ncbi:MAG: type III secretion inner membrane ring lipoprotein SctJ [Chlamydiales bacterium]|nr:type III secretion inner membrane ring lipoprotein SctJ [Chlamydiales bacterium]
MCVSSRLLFLTAVLLIICAGCATQTTIVNNIPEREANEIVVLLASHGIQAQKTEAPAAAGQEGGISYNITVPSSEITEALAILNRAGLPRIRGKTLIDLFGTTGLVPSDFQDRIRYQEGLSEQLAITIRKMDGIIHANVQITFPKEDEPDRGPTASVFVKHRGILDNPNSLTITKIKRLVASAVPGLTPENVTVVTDRALYADITLEPTPHMEELRDFVSIWTVVVAKESANRFRLIFYAFIIVLFLLACFLAWLIWKFWPVIERKGGFFTLFHPHQYEPGISMESEEEEKGGGGEG